MKVIMFKILALQIGISYCTLGAFTSDYKILSICVGLLFFISIWLNLGAFAEFERNIISERTKEGMKFAENVGKRGKDKKPRLKRGGLRKPIPLVVKEGVS